MKQWYERLFEDYAVQYDNEVFTQGTLGECDFIETEIDHNKNIRILDIGCGTGRHSIELAKRGYRVVGIDLSKSQLKRAEEKAINQNLQINFQRQDARNLNYSNEFDLVIMLCEGGFSLMETDEMNFKILQNATNALKQNGKIIFSTLNGLFPLFHPVKDFIESKQEEGNAEYSNQSFDLMTFREHGIVKVEDDFGNKKELKTNERYYVPSEITWILKTLGFKSIDIYGAKLGAYSRDDKLTTEDYEMLVIGQK